MKILQICHKPPLPAKDGGCIAMNNLTHGLLQAGHKVKVLTIYTQKHDLILDAMPAHYLEKTDIEGVFVDTKINLIDAYIAFMTSDSYHINRFFSPDMDIKIARILKKEPYDAIILESLFVTPYLSTIRKHKKKAPVILRAHNVEHSIWEKISIGTGNPIKRWYLNFLTKQLREYEQMMFNLVDGIATIADTDKIRMMQLGAHKPIKTIPFGLHLNEYKPQAQYRLNLFHLGAMDWEPNIEGIRWFVENIWPKVHAELPDLELMLAGRNMPNDWKKWNYPNVNIIGEVDDALAFIKDNGIMVVPLLSGGGIRVKIIEGLALGKPIISSTIGAVGIEDKTGNTIRIADSAEEWIQNIKDLIQSESLRSQVAKESRAFAESHFDHVRITSELIQFIKQIQKK